MNLEKAKLSEYTSLRFGGQCDLVRIKNEEDLMSALMYAKTSDFRVHVLGEGTNTFFANDLKNLLVLKMEMKGIEIREDENGVFITVKAGEIFDDIVNLSTKNNWWGIENLSYIPGTVGASPVQNIGAYGVELKDVLDSLRAYDIKEYKFLEFKNEECNFCYRDSLFKKESSRYIICGITLKLSKNKNPKLYYKPLDILKDKENLTSKDVRELVIKTRTEKLPDYKKFPNAGSFFKNVIVTKEKFIELQKIYPKIKFFKEGENIKIPTAWLIENVAEMKGVKIGNVGTCQTQPLVLINYGANGAQELFDFEKEIKRKIFEKTGIEIEREVNYVS